MTRAELEKYLDHRVKITVYDLKEYEGILKKSQSEEFKNDLNLFLPYNYYFVVEKCRGYGYITESPLFKCSHIKRLEVLD